MIWASAIHDGTDLLEVTSYTRFSLFFDHVLLFKNDQESLYSRVQHSSQLVIENDNVNSNSNLCKALEKSALQALVDVILQAFPQRKTTGMDRKLTKLIKLLIKINIEQVKMYYNQNVKKM